MDNSESDERVRKGTYKGGPACGVCGNLLGADFIRCPEDGIIAHNNGRCSLSYHNKELGIEQMLCGYSFKAKMDEDERRRKKELLETAKVIFVLLIGLIIFLWVKRWL